MLLVTHIVFALSSVPLMFLAAIGRFFNFRKTARLALAAELTLFGLVVSGTLLVIYGHAKVTGACIEGSIYVVLFAAAYLLYRKAVKSKEI